MRAEPWGLVHTDHGSSMIRCTPTNYMVSMVFALKNSSLKTLSIKRTKDLNYFSLCALNLFNTRVSQFELNY